MSLWAELGCHENQTGAHIPRWGLATSKMERRAMTIGLSDHPSFADLRSRLQLAVCISSCGPLS